MPILAIINIFLGGIFVASIFHRAIYVLLRFFEKNVEIGSADRLCRYAVLIAARNEEAVIGHLLDSIRTQDYPEELVDIYVVADNCTDETARIAAEHGAIVYERQNEKQIGKGYALSFLFTQIEADSSDQNYDGFFVFDADNLLSASFISEMNKVFSNGAEAVIGCRNTKNFGDNWVAAGNGILFLHESEQANRVRNSRKTSCVLTGTGYVLSSRLLSEFGGWQWFTMCEDLELTAALLTKGERIEYCSTAVFYDEQPRVFGTSVVQRARWLRGYLMVIIHYRKGLVERFGKEGGFACYDFLATMAPLFTWQLAVVVNLIGVVFLAVGSAPIAGYFVFCAAFIASTYLGLYFMGLSVLVIEGEKILCPRWKRFAFSFTFPLFMFSFVLVFFPAFFGKVEWKMITHDACIGIEELEGRKVKDT